MNVGNYRASCIVCDGCMIGMVFSTPFACAMVGVKIVAVILSSSSEQPNGGSFRLCCSIFVSFVGVVYGQPLVRGKDNGFPRGRMVRCALLHRRALSVIR